MASFRLSCLRACAAPALLLAACSGAGGAPAAGQSGGSAQSAGFVPQSTVAAAGGGASAMGTFPKPLPDPLIALGTPAVVPDLTKPIINDSGAYLNGVIIVGTNTVNGDGVEGVTKGSGAGLYGHSASSSITSYGVYGFSPGGAGVYGYDGGSGAGLKGASVSGYGVQGTTGSVNSYGGYFTNTGGGTALDATSAGNAIYATNTDGPDKAAIVGYTSPSNAMGGNVGVQGVDNSQTTCSSACLGQNYGLQGISNNGGVAVYASTNGGYGVYSTTSGGTAVYGDGGTGVGLEAYAGTGGTPLYIRSGGTHVIIANNGVNDVMSLDSSGNLTISGTLNQNGTPLVSTAGGVAQIENVGDAQTPRRLGVRHDRSRVRETFGSVAHVPRLSDA